jgi:hypothetical protein
MFATKRAERSARGTAAGEMASNMGFLDRFRVSSRTRLTNELASLVGGSEALAARLARHAAIATPNLKAGVQAIADRESTHLKQLKAILSARNVWPRPPERAAHDGVNNWERLGADLALLGTLAAGFHRAAAEWESIDAAVADQLAAIAVEDDHLESELRQLALRCDPQAVD